MCNASDANSSLLNRDVFSLFKIALNNYWKTWAHNVEAGKYKPVSKQALKDRNQTDYQHRAVPIYLTERGWGALNILKKSIKINKCVLKSKYDMDNMFYA